MERHKHKRLCKDGAMALWDSGIKLDCLESPVGFSEAEYANLPSLNCKKSWRELKDSDLTQDFVGLSSGGGLSAHTALVTQIPHSHEYYACYVLWKETGAKDDFFTATLQHDLILPSEIPDLKTTLVRIKTFESIRVRAVNQRYRTVALLVARHEMTYRLILCGLSEYIFQIQNMPNFHKDMKMLCKIISNTAKVAADPPAESANNVTEEEPIIPTQEQLEMQRGLRSLVRNSRHDLKMDDHILSSAEWIGPDSVRTAFMREMGLLKTRLPDDQGVPAPMYNILLYGPEGTGKTAIVYSFAKWAGWTFYDVDLSAILDDKVGQNEKFVQILCEEAQAHAPSIIYFDDIDGLLLTGASSSQGYELKLLSCVKLWLSRLQQAHAQVLVVATSNCPWRLDRIQGLPRHFPTQIHVRRPEKKHRRDLFKSMLKKSKIFHEIRDDMFTALVEASEGRTGHDIGYAIYRARKRKVLDCLDATYFIPCETHGQIRHIPAEPKVTGAIYIFTELMRNIFNVHHGPVNLEDLKQALRAMRPSVKAEIIKLHQKYEDSELTEEDLTAAGAK